MASIKFLVKSTEKGRLATVYLRYVDQRMTDIIIKTPYKLYPECWDNKKQQFKQRILFDEFFNEKEKNDVKQAFNKIVSGIQNEHLTLKGGLVTKEWLTATMNKSIETAIPISVILNQYLQRYIEEAKSGVRLTKDKHQFSKSYVKNLESFKTQIDEFQGIYTEKNLKKLKDKGEMPRKVRIIDFGDITIDFYENFVKFFVAKNYGPNTIGKHIKSLKTIMRDARDEKLHSNLETERKAFKSVREESFAIYLTEKEVRKLQELDFSGQPGYDLARDVFLVGCYTAQRFSDYSRIVPENIRTMENGKKVIDLVQQKTGEKVVVPLRPELETILRKYGFRLPKTYEQKLNVKIKEIADHAGITEPIPIEQSKGGLRVKTTSRKCDLVSSHTARRTGCTLMYLAGIPTLDIMKISGHRSEREFLKYIRVSKEETAINLSNHPYFIGNPLSVAK